MRNSNPNHFEALVLIFCSAAGMTDGAQKWTVREEEKEPTVQSAHAQCPTSSVTHRAQAGNLQNENKNSI